MTRPRPSDYVILLVLAILWGSSFTLIKIAMESLPPLSAAAGRIALAAAILWVLALWQRQALPRGRRVWAAMFGMGLFGNSLPFVLINWGETRLDGGMTAILMAFVPLSTLLLAHLFTDDEKLNWNKVLGVGVGFSGLLIVVGPGTLGGLGADVLHQLAVLGGAFCYAVTGIVARHLAGQPRLISGAVMLTIGALLVAPLAILFDRPAALTPSGASLAAVAALGIFPTALATVLLLRVVASAGASFLAFNNYLVPVFGVAIGAVVLGEPLKAQWLAALTVILAGVYLSGRSGRWRRGAETAGDERR